MTVLEMVLTVGFLYVVWSMVKPAIDYVWERLKRIRLAKQWHEDRVGWMLLLCLVLLLVSHHCN